MENLVSEAALIRLVRQTFAHFPQIEAPLRRLNEMFNAGRVEGQEPDFLLLLGEPGTGKSTLLKYFARQHPRIVHETFTEVPVLYVPIPFQCSTSGLLSAELRELGSPMWDKGTDRDKLEQLTTLSKACRVRLIVPDEVNHLIDRGKEKTHYKAGDCIKQTGDNSFVPHVLAGIPRSRALLETNEQLADRMEVMTLERFSPDPSSRYTIADALGVFHGLLEAVMAFDLAHPVLAEKLAFATDGRLRAMRRVLVRAIQIAFRKPTPKITVKDLEQAFLEMIFPGAPPERNPFSKKFNKRPLDRAGEPFAPRRQGQRNG